MTTLATAPIQGDLLDELALLADPYTPRGLDDAARFEAACRAVAVDGWVNPNDVRARLTVDGELQIAPRKYAALWLAATGRAGFMDTHRDRLVPITGAGSKGNTNKQVPLRKLRCAS